MKENSEGNEKCEGKYRRKQKVRRKTVKENPLLTSEKAKNCCTVNELHARNATFSTVQRTYLTSSLCSSPILDMQ